MIVVDSNVFVSLFSSNEAYHEISRTWVLREVQNETTLVLPVLALPEVSGSIARRSGQSALARRIIKRFSSLPNLRLENVDRELGILAAEFAADLRLRGADAVFVALAYQLSVPLVTWDKEVLNRAANTISVLQPSL